MPDLHISLDGLDFFGRPGLGPFAITKGGIDGWDDGVAMRGEKSGRPQSHGSYRLPRYQESRTVTLNGIVLGTNKEEQEAYGLQLSGILAGGTEGRLQIQKNGFLQWATASVDVVSVDERPGSFWSDLQIVLWCADPRKFGAVHPYTAKVGEPTVVSHRGNFDATPRITVTGSMPGGYTLTVNGWDYQVTVPLMNGKPHVVDYGDGMLRVNGVLIQDALGNTNTTTIPKGPAVGFGIYPGTTGTATAVMEVIDTYI